MFRKLICFSFFIVSFNTLFAQATEQTLKYRSEDYGNVQYRREGTMDGNLVRTLFYNNGEVAQWPFSPSGEWPKGSGHNYLDGVCVLIASEIETNGGIVHPLETSYREWMDKDPVTGEVWGLEPVPGYTYPSSEKPAINNDPTSWPEAWPSALPNITSEWNGFWYGYFGRGVNNADFETFYVMDDSKDGEFSRPPYNYFPIESDHNRKGLGLRVEVRGFQWSHVLAEDIIFWHYDIVNISDRNYEKTYFGFYTDTGVGGSGDNGDDNASFDTKIDLAYAFDDDGFGAPGRFVTGYYGYAYLESPGDATNGIDDDEDGMIDERRDDGIDNDNDWLTYLDLNGNGEWDADENEPLNNDVGEDGVGPFDPQYIGPDKGEGDGLPTDGEPNFDKTDKDESDQIGLTSLSIYRLGDGGTGGGWPKDDEQMWLRMQKANYDTSLQRANISMVFASGIFPLSQNLRERFSMALVFGNNFDDMVFNKETVQQIYNANYNFSKPPLKPIVKAVPGDGKVFIYWDNSAEESRDPFLGFENNDPTQGYKKDFEGYLIYRSTEPEFNDIKVITDSKGEAKFWKPIAQFDKIDGIYGPDPVGINGASFWRGNETGLQHSYVDEDVVNGQKYYYAVVSYDQGDPSFGTKGLVPSECTKIISEDFSGVLKFVDYNCAVVTPNAPAAGYIPPQVNGNFEKVENGIGTGNLIVGLLSADEIKDNAVYKILFESAGNEQKYNTTKYKIIRTAGSATDTLMSVNSSEIGANKFSTPFDGMTISINNDTTVAVIDSETGWLIGSSNLTMNVFADQSSPAKNVKWPADYEIHFYAEQKAITPFFKIPINFEVINVTSGKTVEAEVFDNNGDKTLSIGDEISIIERVGTDFRLTWRITYYQPAGMGFQPRYPEAGDVFLVKISKQFATGDYFTFTTNSSKIDEEIAKGALDKISVVPNPYIATNKWEKRNLNQTGRGERRIDFINLPSDCTIRIYTVTGSLIKTLYKNTTPTDGTVTWNLVSDDGMDVAFGLYIYHVDAPGIGTQIGKFAIIK
ncbi:MAG: hypothetical protein KJ571_09885 [Bacteroidetes bacterium]|nr:hypothetical protein [Bacteroidota bacterium]